jgi:hypothetical protein
VGGRQSRRSIPDLTGSAGVLTTRARSGISTVAPVSPSPRFESRSCRRGGGRPPCRSGPESFVCGIRVVLIGSAIDECPHVGAIEFLLGSIADGNDEFAVSSPFSVFVASFATTRTPFHWQLEPQHRFLLASCLASEGKSGCS